MVNCEQQTTQPSSCSSSIDKTSLKVNCYNLGNIYHQGGDKVYPTVKLSSHRKEKKCVCYLNSPCQGDEESYAEVSDGCSSCHVNSNNSLHNSINCQTNEDDFNRSDNDDSTVSFNCEEIFFLF